MTWNQLLSAMKKASAIVSVLSVTYRELNLYLVLCRGRNQMTMPRCALDVLRACPDMAADGSLKTSCMEAWARLQEFHKGNRASRQSIEEGLEWEAEGLEFADDIIVEVRMGILKYDSIWRLQKDPAVDQALTPHSKASIRISLGYAAHLVDAKYEGTAETLNTPPPLQRYGRIHEDGDEEEDAAMEECGEEGWLDASPPAGR